MDFFERLTDVCHKLLIDNPILLDYLKARKITAKTIKDYKIGSFPEDLRDLYNRYGLDAKELRERGIIWSADQSQFKLYPLVLPIMDTYGKIIAIGCRTVMDDSKRKELGIPKYLNSVYKKTHYLYGMYNAIDEIRKQNKAIVTEGYLDCITAQQNGHKNVVATLGTIFSERQLILLSRYCSRITVLFDADEPGKRASNRVVSKFAGYDEGIKLSYAFVPSGKDLDEFLVKGGKMEDIKEIVV
jgi:DNA primase